VTVADHGNIKDNDSVVWGIETTRNEKSMQKADLSTGRRCIDGEQRAMACKLSLTMAKTEGKEESFYRLTLTLVRI
jgi:hypothetical protein